MKDHPYTLPCDRCGGLTPHDLTMHHSGERLPRCRVCGGFAPPLRRKKRRAVPLKNPAPASDVAAAKRLYQRFTGKRAHRVVPVPLTPLPKAGLAFGELLEIGYVSFRDGAPYRHRFGKKARPLLVASHDGRQLLIVGGQYAFTDRGIEDDD